jgi:UV DNA damage endonuclease
MKIGYPCINRSLVRSETSTFRLASYSEDRLIKTINNNLVHLSKILNYNVENHLLFFRISSDLIPFASHPICKYNWLTHFKSEFKEIGGYITKNNIGISASRSVCSYYFSSRKGDSKQYKGIAVPLRYSRCNVP